MSTTPDMGLPLLSETQQQPEVTHNEALELLTAALYGVIQVSLNTPPGSPTVGDSYVVGAAPTGAWASRAKTIARYTSGGWRFLPDRNSAGTIITMGARQEGLRVWDKSTNNLYVWDGAAWVSFASVAAPPADYGQRAVSNNSTVIAVTAAVDPTLSTNSDYIQVTGIFNATPDGENEGVTQQTNTFTIAVSGDYRIEFWANAKSSVNNTQIGFKFAVNGVIGLVRRPKIFIDIVGEVHPGGAFGYSHFAAGDVISLWLASDKTANITIEDLVFGTVSLKFD